MDEVTKEFFEMLRYRKHEYEVQLPALIASQDTDAYGQAMVAAGKHQELTDLLNTEYEEMK